MSVSSSHMLFHLIYFSFDSHDSNAIDEMPIGLSQCRNLEILHLGKKYIDIDISRFTY